ncbi:MAG: sigma-70 family RNA polymerase sigma factor [Actinomycetota bacterium]|jgi:RNA polymerase sigma-70 factor (ECF subfamily)
MALDDLALVKAANEGDRQALDQLLRTHYDRIYAVCRRVTGSEADAADAAQEAMISIVRGLSKFDGRSAFSTWAYRIATNASLDELRRRRRRPVLAMSGDDDEHTDIGDRVADPVSSQRIDAIGDRMALDAALREVPEVFRVPLVLRDVGDLDYGEIADILDTPVGTVKSRIARGRAALSELLRSGNQTDPDTRRNTDL